MQHRGYTYLMRLLSVLAMVAFMAIFAEVRAEPAQQEQLVETQTLNDQIVTLIQQGKYTEALPLAKRVLAIREQALGLEHPEVATSLNGLAGLYLAQSKYAQAEPLYQRALAILRQTLGKKHPDVAASLNNLAWLYYLQNRHSLALYYAQRASRIYHDFILDNSRVATGGGHSERSGFKDTFARHLMIAAARMAEAPELRTELTTETFEIGQLFHDETVGNALAKMAARFAGGSGELANLARDKEDTQMAWQKANADLVTALGKPTDEQNPTLIQDLRTQAQELQTKLNGLNERLAQEFPNYAELILPRPVTLEQAQQLLKPGESLVAYALGTAKSWVWLITSTSASFRQIDRTAEDIDQQVKTLRSTLNPDDNVGLQQPFPVATAYALYQDILGPESAQLTDVKTLFVAADGALESLPFAVLVTAAPMGDLMDYQQIPWLSRTLATVTLPTVSNLDHLRTLASKGEPAKLPFVGFGDPDFGDKNRGVGGIRLTEPTSTSFADPNTLRQILTPIPETADELRTIAQTLGSGTDSIFLRDEATVTTVKATPLAQYRIIGFATHALDAGQIEEYKLGQVEPAIILSPPQVATADNDGLLRASQVAQLKLNADLVVLSADNSAAPDGTPGAVGLSGLAKAFFYAGTKAILASHWSIASKSGIAITTGMFKIWQGRPELGWAEALRQAEMAVLDNPDEPYFTHPGAWAPFIVAGQGGETETTLAVLNSNVTAAPTADSNVVDFAMLQDTGTSKPIRIQDGATLRSGDGYFFHLQTVGGSENYLYVYQVDSAGKVFRLFPNTKYRTTTNPIPAHTRITLPNEGEEFFLDTTVGKEDFYFIASATPLPALEQLESGTLADITNQGLRSRGAAGVRTKTVTVAAPTGETQSTVQEFIFADNLVHSFSIMHE